MSSARPVRDSSWTIKVRAGLVELPSYQPGRRPDDAGLEQAKPVRLASNELPFGPLASVKAAMAEALNSVHRYPDFFSRRLVTALADRFNVDSACIVVDDGSSALCLHVIESVCEPGAEVVIPRPSFDLYSKAVLRCGARPIFVPLRGNRHYDFAALLAAVTSRTRALVVCNPNNPTGCAISEQQIMEIADALPAHVLLVVDEAYREFVGCEGERPDSVPLVHRRPVAVLRTFSKAYGLAGVRVGYAVTSPDLADILRKLASPFAVSSLAEQAALAALADIDEVERRVSIVRSERERVEMRLEELGLPVVPSFGNFAWIACGEKAISFAEECEKRRVLVRPFPSYGVRVTIGSSADNDRFLDVVEAMEPAAM